MKKEDSILHLLPAVLRSLFFQLDLDYEKLMEIRLRSGQPLFLLYAGKECAVSRQGRLLRFESEDVYRVSTKEIQETLSYVSRYSLYAFEEEIRQGYITVSGGHRVGLCGKAVMEESKVKTLQYVSFINIRIAHEVKNCSAPLLRYLYQDNKRLYNTLLISPPLYGKTTLLRDIVRNVSDGNAFGEGINVGLTDERSEIAAAYRGIPQNDVGKRTDVLDAMPKTYGIMMLIRTMSPQVIAVDEIGSERDAKAILYGVHCGCSFIGTIHGASVDEIRRKEYMQMMLREGVFKRFLLIGRNQKEERKVYLYNERFEKLGEEMI